MSDETYYAPDGSHRPRLRWTGVCNQCGQCCVVRTMHNGVPINLVCENLRAYLGTDMKPLPLGHPGATKCAKYEQRVDGMPIKLLDPSGTPRMVGECRKDHWLEDQRILVNLGKGCSLKLGDPADVPLNTFIPTGGETR